MPEFNNPPTIDVLKALNGTSIIDDFKTIDKVTFNNINKAVRLWYTITLLTSEFKVEKFTSREWRSYIDPHGHREKGKKLCSDDGSIATKNIREIISYQEHEWNEWKQSLIDLYLGANGQNMSESELSKYLVLLEKEKPFNVTGVTIFNDILDLEKKGYLEFYDNSSTGESRSKFKLVDRFPSLLPYKPISQIPTEKVKIEDSECLSDDFSSYTYLFSRRINDIQRFFIHADYRMLNMKELELTQSHQAVFIKIWQLDITPALRLLYYSANENKTYHAIVSPVRIYYHQRGFYLCGFGIRDTETQSNWHNFRIDRINKIDILDSSKDDIPRDLQHLGERIHQEKLIEEIENSLEAAYGFDFYLKSTEMILRFNRDFYDRYIENTFRHGTFKYLSTEEELDRSALKHPNLRSSIAKHPSDAYCRMEYRIDDNTVIMRLRAWGQNVEVLSPPELRQRIYDDLKETWAMYGGDPPSSLT